jgi:PAS domain S-box-containing protein
VNDKRKSKAELIEEIARLRRRLSALEARAGGKGRFPGEGFSHEELRSANSKLQTLVQAIPDMVFFKDSGGRHLIVNRAFENFAGLSQAEVEGRTNEDLLPPGLAEQCTKSDAEALRSRGPVRFEEQAHKGDETVFLDTIKSPIFDDGGDFAGLVGVSRDITGRKRAEEELANHRERLEELVRERTGDLTREINDHMLTENVLRESEERFRGIYEESPVGIELYDPRGALVDANRACLDIFGVSDPDEIRGFSLFEDPNVSGEIKEKLLRGERVRYEAPFDFEKVKEKGLYSTRKSGVIYLDVQITPLRGRDGEAVHGYLAQIQDATGGKLLEQQLRHAQKMEAVGQLAGGIAHDFNNIIYAISNFAYLLDFKMDEDDPLREYVSRISVSAERAASLTGSLLSFSRKQPISPRPVDLNEIVESVEKLLSRLIGENIGLRVRRLKTRLTVMADSHQMEQVLLNLATNARDAMPDGGSLDIVTDRVKLDEAAVKALDAEAPGPHALVSFTDTGHGMDGKTRESVFEPFFTTKEVGRGTGLGLSIVYGIVKQHGGAVNVRSRPGKGAAFGIYLPIVEPEIKSAGPEKLSIPAGKGETVLLAEDDAIVRKVTGEILREYGYRVVEAADGEEAVRKYRENREDIRLLILDMIMPGKTGRQACTEIRTLDPGVKAIFVSGYTDKEIIPKEDGDFVSKPVTPGELLAKIRKHLDG